MSKKYTIKFQWLTYERIILNEDGLLKGYVKAHWGNWLKFLIDIPFNSIFKSILVLDESRNELVRINPPNKFFSLYPTWDGVVKTESGEKPFLIKMERKIQARWHLDILFDNRVFCMKDQVLAVNPMFYNQQNQLLAKCKWNWLKENIMLKYMMIRN